MTALVLENLGLLPALARSLRMLLARLARTLDDLVSAKAARTIPEWRMREVRDDIKRHLGLIRAGELRRQREQVRQAPAAKDVICLPLPESAICNFGR
jgi:hypothetical protein